MPVLMYTDRLHISWMRFIIYENGKNDGIDQNRYVQRRQSGSEVERMGNKGWMICMQISGRM